MQLMLDECGVLPQHTVLAALSGGADSVVLLHLLCAAQREGRVARIAAAHLHHGLRGAKADADEAFCTELCARWGVPLTVARADVRLVAKQEGLSIETAARRERYRFLRAAARAAGADCIAVGHHMDDQAETLLLHLLRGSGLLGLCGMPLRADDIVRPLLHVRRAEIEDYARANGLAFCTDETNGSDEMTRNRVRHELLPKLLSFNPHAVERLAATAALLRQDEDCLAALAGAALAAARTQDGGYDRAALRALDVAVRSRVCKALLLEAQDGDVEQRDVARLDALLAAQTGTKIELRGGRAAWVDAVALHVGALPAPLAFSVPLAVPGVTHTPAGSFYAAVDGCGRPDGANEACIDLDALPSDAVARTRRPGDRFHPLGAPGMRKLSDVMTDRKLPRFLRDIPLLCSGAEVLWMPGYTVSERLRITPQTKRILHMIYQEGRDNG